jgi:hypothetical protein
MPSGKGHCGIMEREKNMSSKSSKTDCGDKVKNKAEDGTKDNGRKNGKREKDAEIHIWTKDIQSQKVG